MSELDSNRRDAVNRLAALVNRIKLSPIQPARDPLGGRSGDLDP